jgi:RecA/RadA recombinase
MKKVLFVVVLLVAGLVVNAQQDTTKTTKKKSTTTTVSNQQAGRVAVMVADLQKPITDNIAKDYAGFTLKEATKVTLNKTVTYEVVVVKDTTTKTLVYDKDGKFVKLLPEKAVM